MAKKKRRVNKKKIRIFVLVVLLIFILLALAIWQGNKLLNSNKEAKVIKVVDKIDEYGYNLNENETDYYKKIFKKLKKELSKETPDEEEYAKLISQLFISDFYSLNNSTSKNDVGGIQFVYTDFQNDFVNLAKESVYSTVESNIYGERKQKLPVVSEVVVNELRQESFEYSDKSDDAAYVVDLTVNYKEDMGYQKDVILTLIHNENKLEIAKMK